MLQNRDYSILQCNHQHKTRSSEDVATFYCRAHGIQLLLFPIYHSRMEQAWYGNKKTGSFLSFKKFLFNNTLVSCASFQKHLGIYVEIQR